MRKQIDVTPQDSISNISSRAVTRKRDKKFVEKSTASKYTVGSRLDSGAIVKLVKSEDWELSGTDNKRNKLYNCRKCKKEGIRHDNRRTHRCN